MQPKCRENDINITSLPQYNCLFAICIEVHIWRLYWEGTVWQIDQSSVDSIDRATERDCTRGVYIIILLQWRRRARLAIACGRHATSYTCGWRPTDQNGRVLPADGVVCNEAFQEDDERRHRRLWLRQRSVINTAGGGVLSGQRSADRRPDIEPPISALRRARQYSATLAGSRAHVSSSQRRRRLTDISLTASHVYDRRITTDNWQLDYRSL